MIIQADKEGINLLVQVQDAILRGHGLNGVQLYTALQQAVKPIDETTTKQKENNNDDGTRD